MKGNVKNPILNFEKIKKGTIFEAKKLKKKGSLKNWLGGSINISGSVKIDDETVKALKEQVYFPVELKKFPENF